MSPYTPKDMKRFIPGESWMLNLIIIIIIIFDYGEP